MKSVQQHTHDSGGSYRQALPGGGSQFEGYPLLYTYAPPSLAVRQQPLILKSMRNTTPPVRPRAGGIT
jgi:hypothetical protein